MAGQSRTRLASALKLALDVAFVTGAVVALLNALLFLVLLITPDSPLSRLLSITTLYEVPAEAARWTDVLERHDARASLDATPLAWVAFRSTSRWFLLGTVTGSLAYLGLCLAVVLNLRRVLESVEADAPFRRDNVRRLRVIGWALIAAVLVHHVLEFGLVIYMRSVITVAGAPAFPPLSLVIEDLHLETLGVGLVVLALAGIFRVGTAMQEEQSLTV